MEISLLIGCGILGVVLLSSMDIANGDVCDQTYSISVRKVRSQSYLDQCTYYTSCGWWGRRCRRTRSCYKSRSVIYYVTEYRTRKVCCEGFTGLNCEIPKCYDDSECYPGTCSISTSTCMCSSGFSGVFCNNIEDGGEYTNCGLVLEIGQITRNIPASCIRDESGNARSYYTDMRSPATVKLSYDVVYNTPDDVAPLPSGINETKFGLIESYAELSMYHKDDTVIWGPEHIQCTASGGQSGPSSANPYHTWQCDYTKPWTMSDDIVDLDYLKVEVVSKSGGYKRWMGDSGAVQESNYTGSTSKTEGRVIFDLQQSSQCLWRDTRSFVVK